MFGQCCVIDRPRRPRGGEGGDPRLDTGWMGRYAPANGFGFGQGPQNPDGNYAEQMRLDAIKAENERKTRQVQSGGGEVGLPAFPEHDVTKPLNADESDEETLPTSPYRDNGGAMYRGGYAQAPHGTRAVDEYHSPTRSPVNANANVSAGAGANLMGYPPNKQYAPSSAPSTASPPPSTYAQSTFSKSTYSATPAPQGQGVNQYLAVGAQQGHTQYPSGRDYGHLNSGTTCT